MLAGILLFSFFFRVIQIDTAFFGPEQAWIALDSWKLANLREFPTHMFNASAGYSQLPLAIYITFIPYLFSDSVYALLIFNILLNVIAIGLCWWFTRRYWGWQAAAIATIVYASMPWAVIFSYRIISNTLLPPFVMLWAIACALAFAEGRSRWLMVVWGSALLATQLHTGAAILLVIAFTLTWRMHLKRAWLYALVGSALALLPAMPWLYAQMVGSAELGLDFHQSVGTSGLRIRPQRILEFLTAADLTANYHSESREALATRIGYMGYLAPFWSLLYGGALLYVFRMLRQTVMRRRPLYLLLVMWYSLPFAFILVASSSYTILYYMPLLPAPCIALALLWKRFSDHYSSWRLPVTMGVLLLCTLNLSAVWSISDHIRVEMQREDPASLAFTIDSWVFPPLALQLEIVEEMRSQLEAGEAAGLIIMQYALPHESQYALRWPFPYHLRGYDVRTVNLNDPRLMYPEQDSLYLRNAREVSDSGAYREELELLKQVGPYVLYSMPGGSGPAPRFPLAEQPGYANGLRLLGYDELMCDGNWRLHWAPPKAPGEEDEQVHFFVHLLGASGETLAQQDQRAFNARPWIPVDHREKDADDAWDWRVNDQVISSFDFGSVVAGVSIEAIRVGLYTFSDETLSPGAGIYALDEEGRPWEYAVDLPYEGVCSS